MARSLWFRLFGLGKIPRGLRPRLVSEGVTLADEGLRCRVHYHHYRAPGKRFHHKHLAFPGSLVVTRRRLAALTPSKPIINISLDDPHLDRLSLSLPGPDHLRLEFEAGDFDPSARGRITCDFFTPRAALFRDLIFAATGAAAQGSK